MGMTSGTVKHNDLVGSCTKSINSTLFNNIVMEIGKKVHYFFIDGKRSEHTNDGLYPISWDNTTTSTLQLHGYESIDIFNDFSRMSKTGWHSSLKWCSRVAS